MSELDPQPGEIWDTDAGRLVWREDGWHWTDGKRCNTQDWTPIRLVGYTVEYVEKLRAERDAAAAARDNAQEYGVERRKDAQDRMWRNRVRNLQAQRDEAEAEVEKLRVERDDLAVDVARFETAAREALAPIQELHRPVYWVYTGEVGQFQDPECSSKDGVHACNSRAGCSRPVWCSCSCNKTIKVRWADCPTARLVYTTDELGGE